MAHDQRTPNGGSTGGQHGNGGNRPTKTTSSDAQKALDAASAEPRNIPTDGHNESASGNPDQRT